MVRVWVRDDHTTFKFFQRTVAAQLHLLGAVAAAVAMVILLQLSLRKADPEHFFACLAFGVTALLVFSTSAVYHFLCDGLQISLRLDQWFENLDHFTIYLFIAGTYTPFIVNVINPPWKSILMVMIWTVAIVGVLYTSLKPHLPRWAQHRYVYTGLFLIMGWTLLVRAGEIVETLSTRSLLLLAGGAASYTLGAIGYATKRPKLFPGFFGYHELWHVSVIVGAGFHYVMILDFYRN